VGHLRRARWSRRAGIWPHVGRLSSGREHGACEGGDGRRPRPTVTGCAVPFGFARRKGAADELENSGTDAAGPWKGRGWAASTRGSPPRPGPPTALLVCVPQRRWEEWLPTPRRSQKGSCGWAKTVAGRPRQPHLVRWRRRGDRSGRDAFRPPRRRVLRGRVACAADSAQLKRRGVIRSQLGHAACFVGVAGKLAGAGGDERTRDPLALATDAEDSSHNIRDGCGRPL